MSLRQDIDFGKLAPLKLQARRVADGVYAGTHRSARRGSGVEFHGHRNYVPGDELRFLDRHAHMRHGMLLVREFETETDRSLRLIVDFTRSMAYASRAEYPEKQRFAALIAAALAHVALTRGDRVALDFMAGGRALPLPSTGGRETFERVVGHLESARPEGELDEAELERALAPTMRHARRGAAVVVLSDLLDLPETAAERLGALSAGGRSLCLVQVLDPAELDFPFDGPVTLRSLEGAHSVETDASKVRAEYLDALEALGRRYRERIVSQGGRLVRVSTLDDPVSVVRRVLTVLTGLPDPSQEEGV